MCSLYERIEALCAQKGVNITQMCRQAGVNRGNLTDLKMGRQTGLSTRNMDRIAKYFGVSIEELLGTAGAREDADLVNGDEELTEYLEMLRSRPECRMLFSVTKNATRDDVEKAVAIIEALRKAEGK